MSNAQNINAIFSILDDAPITLDELENANICSRHQVIQIMSNIVSRGFAERLENGVYRLSIEGKSLKASGKHPVFHSGAFKTYNRNKIVKDCLRNRVWKLIRLQKKFTIDEILAIAKNGDEKDPRNNIQKYLRALKAAGYILETPKRLKGESNTSNGFKQYVLVRDTGNKTPILRPRTNKIYDPNTSETYSWKV